MISPIDVEKQVGITLYYLSDEGQLRKTSNAFGVSRSSVSIIMRRVTQVIIYINRRVHTKVLRMRLAVLLLRMRIEIRIAIRQRVHTTKELRTRLHLAKPPVA